jgi:glycerol dehydrogenase-like iron-containing ADH family enzyme
MNDFAHPRPRHGCAHSVSESLPAVTRFRLRGNRVTAGLLVVAAATPLHDNVR